MFYLSVITTYKPKNGSYYEKKYTTLSFRLKDGLLELQKKRNLSKLFWGVSALALSACGRTVSPDESGTSLVPTTFDDTLRGSSAIDSITGLAGNDIIYGFGGNDQILAGDSDDIIYGGDGDDYIDPGAGFDKVYGENAMIGFYFLQDVILKTAETE